MRILWRWNDQPKCAININDDVEGNPQLVEMGNISYPKDACFTVTITGYLCKPKKKDVGCSVFKTGVICQGDFPGVVKVNRSQKLL